MAGREVREYTNLTDPKGFSFSYLFFFYFYLLDFEIDIDIGIVFLQIKNGAKVKIEPTMKTLLSNAWLLRLAGRISIGTSFTFQVPLLLAWFKVWSVD